MGSNDLKNIPTSIPVVAVALVASDGRILMQRRRLGGAHGGLWEFPGGKVEPGETPVFALIREIAEELGLGLAGCDLHFVARAGGDRGGVVIDLYIARRWQGEPRCLDADEIAWFQPEAMCQLAMPPLDIPLARALRARLESAK